MKPERLLARLGIVIVYVAVFWVAVPAALWACASTIDELTGWRMDPWPPGVPLLALGVGLLARGIAELWRGGGGLPVSALPPPKLARRGPYQYCRHPIYLGFELALVGAGLSVGSPGLAFVVAPAFIPVWVLYARWEERGLLARFGQDYRRYQKQVGWLPRPNLYWVPQLLMNTQVLPSRVTGREHVPSTGGCVLIANHACYLDPGFVGVVTRRPVHFTTTAEAFRGGIMRLLVRRFYNFPVRRYRPDPIAAREVLRRLSAGEVVCVFPEGERSPLGMYQGTQADVAQILARLPVPVIPIGISRNYDIGPRWSEKLRRRRARVRVGEPIDFSGRDPRSAVDESIRALLDPDPQPVDLRGLDLELLERVLWICPQCRCETGEGWKPAALTCESCGARWRPTPEGWLDGPDGPQTLAEVAHPLWMQAEDGPLETTADGYVENDVFSKLAPLEAIGTGRLYVDNTTLRFGDLSVPMADIRSVSTERADTVQIATTDQMWQFRTARGSVFRLHRAIDRWSRAARGTPRVPKRPAPSKPPQSTVAPAARWKAPAAGLAVAAGLLVAESTAIIRPLMDGFNAGGAGRSMLLALLGYATVGIAIDFAVQSVPASVARYAWVRGSAVLAAGLALALGSGQVAGAVLLVFSGAAVWALLVHGRRTWWLAVGVACWALLPILPRPRPILSLPASTIAGTPSIAVVVLDTLRKDRATDWRSDGRNTTPNLSALAHRGVRFDRASTVSCWSLPAHASLLTGHMPVIHGAHYENLSLGEDLPTLPERLREIGYDTAGFSANPLVAPGTGLGRGFTWFDESWREYTLREALFGYRVLARFGASDRDKGGAQVVDDLSAWLDQREENRPFFVLVNLMEAHVPYQEVPLKWRRKWTAASLSNPDLEAIGERSHMAQVLGTQVPDEDCDTTLDLLDGATAAADAYLGEILTRFGQTDGPVIVVVVSDHGELLGEHGYWGHNLGLWKPLLDVPLVIAGGDLPADRVVETPVSLLDLYPTLLDLVGAPMGDSEGVSLVPLLHGDADGQVLARRVLKAEHLRTDFLTSGWQVMHPLADHDAIRARRAAAWRGESKRVVTEDGQDLGFDLGEDPGELDPFGGADTGLDVELPVPSRTGAVPAFDAVDLEALRSLGYVE